MGVWDCRALYHDAVDRGKRLLEELESPAHVPATAYPDMGTIYSVVEGEFSLEQLNPLLASSVRMLRRWNVEPNRLGWCEATGVGADAPVSLARADASGGTLFVVELNREYDTTPQDQRMFISELLWQSYTRDAARQGRPPSSLKLIWVDTIMNRETKIVA